MMVIVDTTVWIDFFAGQEFPHVTALESLVRNKDDRGLYLSQSSQRGRVT